VTSSVCEGRPEAVFVRAKPTGEIVGSFPHSTLADGYAALAYYHDNRMVIDEHIRDSHMVPVGSSAADGIQRLPQRQVNETVSELICSQAGDTEFSILNHSADGCALRRKQHSTEGCTSM
jgi:hypothetical protein